MIKKALITAALVAASAVHAQEMAKDIIFGNLFDAEGTGETSKTFDEFAQCIGDRAKSKSSRATYELREIEGKKVAIIGVSRGPVFAAIDQGDGKYTTKFINTMAGRIIRDGSMEDCK